jgi:hypothetical protein
MILFLDNYDDAHFHSPSSLSDFGVKNGAKMSVSV